MSTLPTREDLLKIAKQASFNLEMSGAVNDDLKTQTRGVIKDYVEGGMRPSIIDKTGFVYVQGSVPKYQIGDTLWVREPAKVIDYNINSMTVEYQADKKTTTVSIPKRFHKTIGDNIGNSPHRQQYFQKWIENKQGIPNGCIKELARTFLRVTNVRVERLQDISDDDCLAEGIIHEYDIYYRKHYPNQNHDIKFPKDRFMFLWNPTAPKGYKWEDNPYVFVYEFEKVDYER